MKIFLRNKLEENNIDLTFEMLQVLKHLWDKEGVNQQELANLLYKDKASFTYLIEHGISLSVDGTYKKIFPVQKSLWWELLSSSHFYHLSGTTDIPS